MTKSTSPYWPDVPWTRAGKKLRRVLTALEELWNADHCHRCLRNLPLLAELLDEAGIHDEARVARRPWFISERCFNNSQKMGVRLTLRSGTIGPGVTMLNTRRFWWFRRGRIRLWDTRLRGSDIYIVVRAPRYLHNPADQGEAAIEPDEQDTRYHSRGIIGRLDLKGDCT